MTDPNFSRPGAVDLSSLAGEAASHGAAGGGNFVVEATEATFNDLVNQSVRYPVLVEFYSPRDTAGGATSAALAQAVNARGGQFLLARVNVDSEPRLAQALQVNAVPMVVALIGGQMAPLFQGTVDAADLTAVLDEVASAAVGAGMTGRAEPQPGAAPQGGGAAEAAPVADPRFEAADAALASGDFAKAVEEFDQLLKDTPNDVEVIAGRAQAALLARSTDFDPAQIVAAAQSNPADLEAQLKMADLEIIQGQPEPAFDRLLTVAAEGDAETKETIRQRLLELFEVVGRTDPVVLKARRRLSTVLF